MLLPTGGSIKLETAEARIQAHTAGLRKELGIVDLALAQIVYIVTLEFFGTAARAGPSHVVLWLLAIAFFFIPQALVVAYLNRLIRWRVACMSGCAWRSMTGWGSWWPGIFGFILHCWSLNMDLLRSAISPLPSDHGRSGWFRTSCSRWLPHPPWLEGWCVSQRWVCGSASG